jgi:hypothetical protein
MAMRKIITLCAAMLCFAGAAAAQNDTTATVADSPAPAAASKMSSSSGYPWQVGTNFAYQRFDIGGASSNLYGIHTTVNRWLNDGMFGIEGAVTATFGRVSPTNRQQILFYGGGIHVGSRSGKFQPWAHFDFGGAHERFNQHIGPAAFNGFGLLGGGGVDIQWKSHIAWRVQADYFGTRFNGLWQKSVSTGVGILFDF